MRNSGLCLSSGTWPVRSNPLPSPFPCFTAFLAPLARSLRPVELIIPLVAGVPFTYCYPVIYMARSDPSTYRYPVWVNVAMYATLLGAYYV